MASILYTPLQISLLPVVAVGKFKPCEAGGGRNSFHVRERGAAYELRGVRFDRWIIESVDTWLVIQLGQKRSGQVALNVAVNQQHPASSLRQHASDCPGAKRLGHSPLEIDEGDSLAGARKLVRRHRIVAACRRQSRGRPVHS